MDVLEVNEKSCEITSADFYLYRENAFIFNLFLCIRIFFELNMNAKTVYIFICKYTFLSNPTYLL